MWKKSVWPVNSQTNLFPAAEKSGNELKGDILLDFWIQNYLVQTNHRIQDVVAVLHTAYIMEKTFDLSLTF